MKVILKTDNYNEILIPTGNFRDSIALAEALLPYTAKGDFWMRLEEEEKAPEPTKSEGEPEKKTTQIQDITKELELQEIAEVPAEKLAKKIDHNKLFALADAGWKKPDIADELGCSEATVYNYLSKRREGKL